MPKTIRVKLPGTFTKGEKLWLLGATYTIVDIESRGLRNLLTLEPAKGGT